MFQFLPDKFWFLEQKSPFPAFDFPSQIITDDDGPSWEGVPGRSTDAIASSWTIPPQCVNDSMKPTQIPLNITITDQLKMLANVPNIFVSTQI